MTPTYRIEMEGNDLTDKVNDRCLELTVSDSEGITSDTFELKLDNGPDRLPLPKKGSKVKIWIGSEEKGMRYKGTFTVDERSLGDEEGEYMLISGKAVDMTKNAKTKRTKSYDNKSYKDIVEDVSKRMGVEARVDDKIGSKKIKHIVQSNESDMHFLTRLAERCGAVYKPVDGANVFALRANVNSLSGKPMTVVTISLGDGVKPGWKLTFQERGKYQKVKAKYHDYRAGKTKTVDQDGKDGDGADSEISRTLHQKFATLDEAQAAAAAENDRLKRGTGTGEFELTWNPDICAGSRCELEGFPDESDGNWKIKTVKHRFAEDGGSTSVSIETPKDKEDKKSKGDKSDEKDDK